MRAGEGGRGEGGGAHIYIYLHESGFSEIEGEDEDLDFFFGLVSDSGLGSCEGVNWIIRGGYHNCYICWCVEREVVKVFQKLYIS